MGVESPADLSWAQRLQLWIQGYAYVGKKQKEGWRGKLNFYVFKCPEHGLVVDYPHGYSKSLTCPYCMGDNKAPIKITA
jgi:hypothetical protein